MFPMITPFEANLIRRDWEAMLHSPEASKVDLKYHATLGPGMQPSTDQVYKVDTTPYGPLVTVECIPCIIQIVNDRNLRILSFGIVEAGDAILYFSETLNLSEPVKGHVAVPDTFHFFDAIGNEWTPVLKDAGPLKRHLGMEFGQQAIAQVVPCTLRKG